MAAAQAAFGDAGFGLAAIPLAFALGLLSAIISACCTLPILTVVVGFAGLNGTNNPSKRGWSALAFFVGAVLSLVILGLIAAVAGQVAQTVLGRYWKLFAGGVAIGMGLASLKLLPLPKTSAKFPLRLQKLLKGHLGSFIFGIIGGGAISVASLACNPGIFIIIGAAVLQGVTLWMFGVLIAYATGFALPIAGLMLGVSFGTASVKFKGIETVLRYTAGILLVFAGFYFLNTL